MHAAAVTITHCGVDLIITPAKTATPKEAAVAMCKLLALFADADKPAPSTIAVAAPAEAKPALPADGLLSVKQVCAFLNKSRTTLDNMRRIGDFPEPIPKRGFPRWQAQTVRAWAEGRV